MNTASAERQKGGAWSFTTYTTWMPDMWENLLANALQEGKQCSRKTYKAPQPPDRLRCLNDASRCVRQC